MLMVSCAPTCCKLSRESGQEISLKMLDIYILIKYDIYDIFIKLISLSYSFYFLFIIQLKQMKKILSTGLKLSPLALLTYTYCSTQQVNDDHDATGLRGFKGFKSRQQHLKEIETNPNYDIVVIGGGASGAGVCIDASTRGLRTLVIQNNDFGSGTSSKSTKLIHGGVRYLEQVFALNYDSISNRIQKFKLVTQAIKQRGVMLRNAAYMNDKISFVIPTTSMFSSAYYYVGSVVYYMIYWFASEKNTIKFNFPYFLHRNELRDIFPYISDKYQSGVVYQDGCFNDSRMLLTTLLTATLSKQEYEYLPNGHVPANILNKADFLDFIKLPDGSVAGIIFQDKITNKKYVINAKYVVNCTGTWADKIRLKDNPNAAKRICIVAGSHLTYDTKIASSRFGLCLPSKDGRILLVVPWLNSVIAGTTQKVFEQPQTNPKISMEQRKFLQSSMADLMDKIPPHQLVNLQKARWTGLRPLVLAQKAKSTKDLARNHVVQRSSSGLYSLMGGKWTTYRKMGEDLVNQIGKQEEKKTGKKISSSKSQNVLLVGSCNPNLQKRLTKDYGKLGQYLYKTYGSLSLEILKGDLTPVIGKVTKAELNYILKNQMVNDVEDILLRRLRIAFLNDKEKTLSIIPSVSRMIIESCKPKMSQKDIEQYIKNNVETICSYQFD